jgi:hypothetical protein
MGDDLCKGCTSKTGMNSICTLEVQYKNKTCPCVDCIVKAMCLKGYTDCVKYKRFCNPQVLHYLKPNVIPPCVECYNYERCLNILNDMAENYISEENHEDLYVFLEENAGDLFCDFLFTVEQFCDKLKRYFPVDKKRDYILWPPDLRNINFSINTWNYRESRLKGLFDTEQILRQTLKERFGKGARVL